MYKYRRGEAFEIKIDGRALAIRRGMLVTIEKYIEHHQPTGGFLQAVLSNQLKEAFGRADTDNLTNLQAFVAFLNWEAPSDCWGSAEKYQAWTTSAEESSPWDGPAMGRRGSTLRY